MNSKYCNKEHKQFTAVSEFLASEALTSIHSVSIYKLNLPFK